MDDGIGMAKELYSIDIFLASPLVGNPLAVLPTIIQIQHGSNGIDSKSIDMEEVQPAEGRSNKEVFTSWRPKLKIKVFQ